jgi:hypothetical protein
MKKVYSKRLLLRRIVIGSLLISVIFLNGCHSTSPLVTHPKLVVRGPAKFGEVLGGTIVGCTITAPFLAAALATGPMAPMVAGPMGQAAGKALQGSKPAFRVVEDYFFVPLFGGIPWLIFGWWGNESENKEFCQNKNIQGEGVINNE